MEDELNLITVFASEVRREILAGEKPTLTYLNRLRDLAEKVQRHFDPQLEEMGNGSA